MKKTPETQTTTENSWQKRAEKAEAQVEILMQELEYMKAQIRLMSAKRYGASSEKTNENQLSLFDGFNEVEATAEPLVPEHKRAKKKGKRNTSLDGLPENIIEYHLPEEEMACSCCGHDRHIINQEITRELHYVPAEISVNVHVQNIYGCRNCESNTDGSQPVVVSAPRPERAFVGSIASPSVVAHIIDEKYVMGAPLYRQEQQWARRGVNISRQNMANWVIHAAKYWFEPIYDRMKEILLTQDIIHADETGLPI